MRRTRFAEGFDKIPNKTPPPFVYPFTSRKSHAVPRYAMLSISLPESVACNTRLSGLGGKWYGFGDANGMP